MDAMNAKMEDLKRKGDSTLQKTVMKWGMAQAEQLVGFVFGLWRDVLHNAKEEKALEEVNKRMADLAAKGDATMQKTMMKWGAQQGEQLVSVTYQSWKEDLMKSKEEKSLDALNQRMADLA